MTAWILDREHPLKAVARFFAIVAAFAPLVLALFLLWR